MYAYFDEDEREPPVTFLKAAAAVLGVREAWLILEEGGMTVDEERMRQAEAALTSANQSESKLWAILAESVPELLEWPRAARAVFCEAWVRYVRGFDKSGGTTEYQMGAMARYLLDFITRPLKEGHGLRRPFGTGFANSADFEDYLLLMMQALMRAIPDAGQGELPDRNLFPLRKREPLPIKKQRKAPGREQRDR